MAETVKVKKNISRWDELTFVRNRRLTPVLQIDLRDGVVANDLVVRENTVPVDVYNGLVLEFYIPKTADPKKVVSALENGEWAHLFEKIVAGAEVWWDGSNRRGRLNDDAADAAYELERVLVGLRETSRYFYMDPADWLGKDFEVEPGLSGSEIERLAEELCEEALADDVYIDREEMIKYLEYLRDRDRD
mgnify:CR=1 FL=1